MFLPVLFVGGMLVYGVVKGKLKGEPASHLSDNHKKQQHSVVVEEMQAKLEKMQQDMNNNIQRQRNVSSISTTEEQGYPNKFPEVPLRSSMPEVTGQRNIFIRSRL